MMVGLEVKYSLDGVTWHELVLGHQKRKQSPNRMYTKMTPSSLRFLERKLQRKRQKKDVFRKQWRMETRTENKKNTRLRKRFIRIIYHFCLHLKCVLCFLNDSLERICT